MYIHFILTLAELSANIPFKSHGKIYFNPSPTKHDANKIHGYITRILIID